MDVILFLYAFVWRLIWFLFFSSIIFSWRRFFYFFLVKLTFWSDEIVLVNIISLLSLIFNLFYWRRKKNFLTLLILFCICFRLTLDFWEVKGTKQLYIGASKNPKVTFSYVCILLFFSARVNFDVALLVLFRIKICQECYSLKCCLDFNKTR